MGDAILMFLAILLTPVAFFLGFYAGEIGIKQQSYERGYMVECLGKEGYYWECDE